MCPCIRHASICLSRYFLLNNWAEFNKTCYITSPHGKGVHASMHPSTLHQSIMLSPPKPLGRIQPNATTSLPLMVRVCESNIIFLCVRCPSICPSCYLLLNHWAEFIQLATSLPLMVRMCESNIIFLYVCLASGHLSVCHAIYS